MLCPSKAGITRPVETGKKRTGVKKRIGLGASILPGVGDRERLEKRVLPRFLGEMLTIQVFFPFFPTR